jgi:hypothetical protein
MVAGSLRPYFYQFPSLPIYCDDFVTERLLRPQIVLLALINLTHEEVMPRLSCSY